MVKIDTSKSQSHSVPVVSHTALQAMQLKLILKHKDRHF